MLSALQVTEIEGRSALLKWGPPIRDQGDGSGAKFESLEHIVDSEFRYEVCLSDKGKDGKYRSIFTTPSIECRLTDLRPCTEYHIRIAELRILIITYFRISLEPFNRF